MRRSLPIPIISLIAAVITVVGCATVRYPSYYTLSLPAPVAVDKRPVAIDGSVAVREFEAPRFLNEGSIVYRETPESLAFYPYDRWGSDPRRAVTTAVIRRMQSQGIFRSVDQLDGRTAADWTMTGNIDHLEEVDHGSSVSVEVSLSARLVDTRTGELLWQGAATKTAKLDKRSVPGVVEEMSLQTQSAIEELVNSMQAHVTSVYASAAPATAGQTPAGHTNP